MRRLFVSTLMSLFAVASVEAVPENLIERLDSDQFSIRSKAHTDLMKWANKADISEFNQLKGFYEKAESPEVKMRLLDVIDNSKYLAVPNTRGFVGITMVAHFGGVGVGEVVPKTAAESVDLRAGDVIVGVDDKDLSKMNTHLDEATAFFSNYVKSKNAGQKLELKVRRGTKVLEKTLKLGDFDKFNELKRKLNAPRFLPQNQLEIQPQLRLQVMPQAWPQPNQPNQPNRNGDVPQLNLEDFRKQLEEQQKLRLQRLEELKKEIELKKENLKKP